jgi:acyl phosphate:glycerol-3-phosphate acyltransferase
MIQLISLIIFAYLAGSISSAIIISKVFKLSDPRNVGSGNPGTTNILRYAGKKAAALTLMGDISKGIIPIAIGYKLGFSTATLSIVGMCSLLGHIYPVFYHFKGGKGIATFLGVLLALNWLLALSFITLWITTALVTRYSSLSALVAITITPVIAYLLDSPSAMFSVLICCSTIIFFHHKQNLINLKNGTEKKIGQKTNV